MNAVEAVEEEELLANLAGVLPHMTVAQGLQSHMVVVGGREVVASLGVEYFGNSRDAAAADYGIVYLTVLARMHEVMFALGLAYVQGIVYVVEVLVEVKAALYHTAKGDLLAAEPGGSAGLHYIGQVVGAPREEVEGEEVRQGQPEQLDW